MVINNSCRFLISNISQPKTNPSHKGQISSNQLRLITLSLRIKRSVIYFKNINLLNPIFLDKDFIGLVKLNTYVNLELLFPVKKTVVVCVPFALNVA